MKLLYETLISNLILNNTVPGSPICFPEFQHFAGYWADPSRPLCLILRLAPAGKLVGMPGIVLNMTDRFSILRHFFGILAPP